MSKFSYRVSCKGRNPGNLFLREIEKNQPGNFSSRMFSTFLPKSEIAPTNSLSRDFLRIGEGIFLCDRAFRRGEGLGGKTRELELDIPVENKPQWEKIKELLEMWAKFVSHDYWKINFSNYKYTAIEKPQGIQNKLKKPIVCLFSDGLDSLCGAAYALRNDENPVFVSHIPPGLETAIRRVNELKRSLDKQNIETHFANFFFTASDRDPVTGRRKLFPERSRRTRPVLYLSMAGAVALELDIKTIRLNENGYMAANLPITVDRTGSDISRHAHPETLKLFENIMNTLGVSSSTFKVENPFWGMTKAREIKYLEGAFDLIRETVSCEYGRQQVARIKGKLNKGEGDLKECGLCIPCLVRRIALYNGGVEEPDDHYAYSIEEAFKAIRNGGKNQGPLFDILRDNVEFLKLFSEQIQKMSLEDFVLKYIYELSLLDRDPDKIPQTSIHTFEICKCFAEESLRFLNSNQGTI